MNVDRYPLSCRTYSMRVVGLARSGRACCGWFARSANNSRGVNSNAKYHGLAYNWKNKKGGGGEGLKKEEKRDKPCGVTGHVLP